LRDVLVTARLESLVTLYLLGGFVLLEPPLTRTRLIGGLVLGAAPAVKIWAVVPLLAAVVWTARRGAATDGPPCGWRPGC
jgi:hypothetical protein